MLPNLLTLANAGCGMLAISKAVDGLTKPEIFGAKMETACWLIFLAMIFDALDGKLARLMDAASDFGAQLDSLADAVTFGLAPALICKVLLEHEATYFDTKLTFLAAAAFALMGILRLARFNLENDLDEESHQSFKGMPIPGAAGIICATVLMYLNVSGNVAADGPSGLILASMDKETTGPIAAALLPMIFLMLPFLGLLMVSRVRYTHVASAIFKRKGKFSSLVYFVFFALLLYMAPVFVLFFFGIFFALFGLIGALRDRSKAPLIED